MKKVEDAQEASEAVAPETLPNRQISKLDLVMRIVATIATLGSAIAVGTSSQMRPFFTDFNYFKARYKHLPAFSFFVIANALACAYLILSLVLSVFHVLKSMAKVTRTVLIVLDMVFLALLTAGGSSAAAIVHLANNGNAGVNWGAVCRQQSSFCERVTGALVGSFIGILVLMLLILLSAVALSRT